MAYGQSNAIARAVGTAALALALALSGAACRGAEPIGPTTGIAGTGGGVFPGTDAGVGPGFDAGIPVPGGCPDPAWACWPMPNPAATGLPNPTIYRASGSLMVVDDVTGLMWQREVPAESYQLPAAKLACGALVIPPFDDWRLPTRIELVSLVDFSRASPGIDTNFFSGVAGNFWTSTPALGSSGSPARAWQVSFGAGGATTIASETFDGRARCVRSMGPARVPTARYRIEGGSPNETVTDLGTGLVWQRAVGETTFSFDEAQAHCAALSLPGSGWRVPSVKELQTLVHDGRTQSPFIDGEAFPGSPAGRALFWTSSPSATIDTAAWFVNFGTGESSDVALVAGNVKDEPSFVRCVR